MEIKLNYISIFRGFRETDPGGDYYVRGELQSQPAELWFKEFKSIWMSSPAYRTLCSDPHLHQNSVIIPVSEGNSISATVVALRKCVELADGLNIEQEEWSENLSFGRKSG